MEIGSKIRKIRVQRNLTISNLAVMCGSDVGNISRIERDKQGVSQALLNRIAAALNVTVASLYEGAAGEVTPTPARSVTSRAEQGSVVISVDGEFATTLSADAFVELVRDDSMAPDFKAGEALIVDPDREPTPGDYVVAEVRGASILRKYRDRGTDSAGSRFELVPLNPDYASLFVDSENPGTLAGVVVEHRRRFAH